LLLFEKENKGIKDRSVRSGDRILDDGTPNVTGNSLRLLSGNHV